MPSLHPTASPTCPLLWTVLKPLIRRRFPNVHQISTTVLALWLTQPDDERPILLDTRTEAEFAVSHLQGAKRVDPTVQAADLHDLDRETPIVTYCSVGYRSSAVCDRLQAAGYTHVFNLEGSLFKWANEGYPVYQNGQITSKVHPYNSFWGLLLHRGLHAYHPKIR